jgi:DNA replication protein DnaC
MNPVKLYNEREENRLKDFLNFDFSLVKIYDTKKLLVDINNIINFYKNDYKSMIILGGTGVGKTHLALAAIRNAIADFKRCGGKVDYCEWLGDWAYPIYVILSAPIWCRGICNNKMFDVYFNFFRGKIVLIDDIGTEIESSIFNNVLYEFYEKHNHKIILTSNLSLPAIKQRYGEKVFSRMCEKSLICIVDGKDYRTKHLNDK